MSNARIRTLEQLKLGQFSIKGLLVGTMLVALILGFVSQEPFGVSLAASFCLASWIGIAYLFSLSAMNLLDAIAVAIREKRTGVLRQRYRWAYVDGLIVIWVLITIVIANFVIENSVAKARFLVMYGWIAIALAAILILFGRRGLPLKNGRPANGSDEAIH